MSANNTPAMSATTRQLETAMEMTAALRDEIIHAFGSDTTAAYVAAAAMLHTGMKIYFDTMPPDEAERVLIAATSTFRRTRSKP